MCKWTVPGQWERRGPKGEDLEVGGLPGLWGCSALGFLLALRQGPEAGK